MNRIMSNAAPGGEGPQVTDLPHRFGFLPDRNVFEMGQREVQKYLDGPDTTGVVDEEAASALNGTLDRIGTFKTPPRSRYIVVAGPAAHEADKLFGGLQVTKFHANDAGRIRLGTDKTDAAGRYVIRCGHRPSGQEKICGQPFAGLRQRRLQWTAGGPRHQVIPVLLRSCKAERAGAPELPTPGEATLPRQRHDRGRRSLRDRREGLGRAVGARPSQRRRPTAESPRYRVPTRNAYASTTPDSSTAPTSCRTIGRNFSLGRSR